MDNHHARDVAYYYCLFITTATNYMRYDRWYSPPILIPDINLQLFQMPAHSGRRFTSFPSVPSDDLGARSDGL